MSPASKSKSKDRRGGKEPPKGASKPPSANAGGGAATSGYNPLLGTFHALDSAPVNTNMALHASGRFSNFDESDDYNGHSLVAGADYDSVSNNGSWSGESEDYKEKNSTHLPRPEVVPRADNDRREKIRQKNEKKHQRQKERRAQELHEKCAGYLMSRKLEALSQQLVAMGFSSERATMALIQNEGKLEESVSWLFEGGEEADKHKEHTLDGGGNLKIDISEEIARIAGLEIKYKCSKQEVERAVVACEGDLDKADETLRSQKQEPQSMAPKPEETGDPPAIADGRLGNVTSHTLPGTSVKSSSRPILSKTDESGFRYAKVGATVGAFGDPGSKNVQPSKKVQPRMDPLQVTATVDKRWSNAKSDPSVSYPPVSSLPSKTEAHYAPVGNELKNLQLGTTREPVILVQRPQSINPRQIPTTLSSSPPATAAGWYPNGTVAVKPNGVMSHIPATRSMSTNIRSTNQLYSQLQYDQRQQQLQHTVASSGALEPPGTTTSQGNGLWCTPVASQTQTPAVAAASSLGLFSGLGTSSISGSSHIDWNNGVGSMLLLDYTNIDWSLDSGSLPSRTGGMTMKNSFLQSNPSSHNSFAPSLGLKNTTRPVLSNSNSIPGFEAGGGKGEMYGGSREWSSPFEERDLFSLTRHVVSSPSL